MVNNHEALTNQQKERWIEGFSRFGIVSKGIVYCLIGILAALPVVGLQGKKMNKSDAFRLIYEQPFGKILLIVIGLGFVGYVTWRLFQAFADIERKGSDTKAQFSRMGYAISAIVYASLSFYALRLAFIGSQGDGESRQFIITRILALPAGEWIIGIVAVLVFGNGIRQIYRGIPGKFYRNIRLIGNQYEVIFKRAGVIGYVSRGTVLAVIGYFFFRAAMHQNSGEIQSTKGAFDFLEHVFGSILMGIVALGLIGYGIFMFVKARYQRIDVRID